MLRQLEPETGTEGGTEGVEWLVPGHYPAIVEANGQVGAPLKSLLVGEISRGGVLRRSRTERATGEDVKPVFLQGADQDWVKAGDVRPEAQRGTNKAIGARADTACAKAGAAGRRARVCAE